MNLSNVRIGGKLAGVFSVILALVVAMGTFVLVEMAVINASTREIATSWLPSVESLGRVNAALSFHRHQEFRHVMSVSDVEKREFDTRLAEGKARLARERAAYEKLITSAEERAGYDAFGQAFDAYLASSRKLIESSGKGEAAVDQTRDLLRGESMQGYAQAGQALDRLIGINSNGAADAASRAEGTFRFARLLVVGALVALVALAATLAIWITRLITQPLRRAVEVAQAVAKGDLTVELAATGKDETAQMLSALSTMTASLRAVVDRVRTDAEGVATASHQIADGNADLSSRTEEQAASLQQTASSMEQLTSAVHQNAGNSSQGSQLARTASEIAERGGHVVEQVVTTMRGISDSSRRIAEINAVIDGIAFQTNILALNAAVEAARAGEQGRGFAVVASEVRTLAQRSAEAAREIKQLIDESVAKVDAGTQLADQAGATMKEVVGSIRHVNDLMGEISAASREQSTGIGQVSDAVSQMDQVTQQNAALVEESAAAAASLKSQAQTLVQAVAVFRTRVEAAC